MARRLTPVEMRPHHPFGHIFDSGALRQRHGEEPDVVERVLASAIERLTKAGAGPDTSRYVILSADIRKSTFLMKEAEDLAEYARVMTMFIEQARTIIGARGGWFDKFMGTASSRTCRLGR